ncbi:uncharacterized protein LOC133209526 [Neopsephotus bourkii]|uniref:uncharacterized protein LOC133209526 n=1 Tax=Neopsephotus bourkii TaxID=309878 RepID=UPI002AA55853|nr:uncharacterized protein LOC133209526 [Neopsephotus bourkii]
MAFSLSASKINQNGYFPVERDHKMGEEWSRATSGLSEHITMKTHLYLLLLAASISAAPYMSSTAELLTLLQQMRESMAKESQVCSMSMIVITYCGRWLPTLVSHSALLFLPSQDVNCISVIFEGAEQLKMDPAMKKFSGFFQKFERLKQSLTPSLGREVGTCFLSPSLVLFQEECDTERKSATAFMRELMTFIRKAALRNARA